ncbi:MAG TPA: NAD-dependent epimerase/dehydratase family protein [Candidatus Hydrogenedentes bacterium]|nr:NAD-dependent epimerase/dehydratase family protein [Candidatus Hydrogenedentota bacterium]HPG68209.1 NAD-dependent epimerase/dehydratase family protein [Candidatus Hydrogenedentota bacterium]
MRVLIIGGTRFLGAYTARELVSRGHDVTVLHRGNTPACLPETVTEILGDARDRSVVEPILASGGYDAVVDTILRAKDLEWYLPVLEAHTKQLVHCGSTGVYAPAGAMPVREDDPTPCPAEFGGFGEKLAQDAALAAFRAKTGFRVCSLRISNVFGAGDVPLDAWGNRRPKFFQRLANGDEVWVPDDGRALLQPVHAADLARGFTAAVEAESLAEVVYNLSSERAVTLMRYTEHARELLCGQGAIRCVPTAQILATGQADEAGLRFVCEHMCIDSSRARAAFGYVPRFDVRAGLRDSLRWMLHRGLIRGALAE